jgi:hypothetical protein
MVRKLTPPNLVGTGLGSMFNSAVGTGHCIAKLLCGRCVISESQSGRYMDFVEPRLHAIQVEYSTYSMPFGVCSGS